MPRLPYTWTGSRYRASNGQFVSRARVRKEIDKALLSEQRRMHRLANQLRGNRITIGRWQDEMRAALKEVHIYSAAAARGGFAQLGAGEYGQIGQKLREQYTYLDGFAADIENGLPLDGRFTGRVELYAQSGRATYHQHDRRVHEAADFTEERSVLGAADHCESCVEEADKDWQAIGEMTPIGERDCLARCHCTVEYR